MWLGSVHVRGSFPRASAPRRHTKMARGSDCQSDLPARVIFEGVAHARGAPRSTKICSRWIVRSSGSAADLAIRRERAFIYEGVAHAQGAPRRNENPVLPLDHSPAARRRTVVRRERGRGAIYERERREGKAPISRTGTFWRGLRSVIKFTLCILCIPMSQKSVRSYSAGACPEPVEGLRAIGYAKLASMGGPYPSLALDLAGPASDTSAQL